MEKKVILLTDYYLPHNNANGLCIHRLGIAMQKMGYEVHVVAYLQKNLKEEEIMDGIYVHRVRPQFFYYMREYYYKNPNRISGKLCWTLALLSRRIKKILLMPWYPLVSPVTVRRYCRKVQQVSEVYQIKNIVAGYNPFESAVASVWLKKRGGYHVIVYFMDTFTVTANAKNSKIIYNRGRAWEKRIYRLADGIANFPTYREHFSSELYRDYQDKMMYAGVPVDFDELAGMQTEGDYFESGEQNLLYTGGLSMGDRDPVYLLDLLDKSKLQNVRLHFFSRGDAEEYLAEWQEKHTGVTAHGQVPYEELLRARSSADIMVNIGSRRETILPSRLFEYIASGKPIIHIAYRKDDPCIPYLLKYPDALILYADEAENKNVLSFTEFVLQKRSGAIEAAVLKDIYADNASDRIANMFDNVFIRHTESGV